MRGFWLLWCMGLVVMAVAAPPAGAQGGGGLYEPFPEPASSGQARRFIERIPHGGAELEARLTNDRLDRGVFPSDRSGGLRRVTGRGTASVRAGVGGGGGLLDHWPAGLAVLSLASAAGVLLARRRA